MCQCSILSKVYESSYPVSIYNNNDNDNITDNNNILAELEQERLARLLSALTATVIEEVRQLVCRVTGAGGVVVPPTTAQQLLAEVVRLGELEPYGVRGGALVVAFTDSQGRRHNVGRILLDPCPTTVQTYELQLEMFQNDTVTVWLANIVRKLTGRSQQIVMNTDFQLTKKKLYRSSSERGSSSVGRSSSGETVKQSSSIGRSSSGGAVAQSGDKSTSGVRKTKGVFLCPAKSDKLVLKTLAFSYP